MNFLISLLAFATVMILLSTLVMMIVNGVNGLMRMRSRTLERAMRLLFEDVIAPRLEEEPTKASSKQFARELLRNPSLRTPGTIIERTWIGPKYFDRLSSRSFVEQFARTRAGQALAEKRPTRLTQQLEGVLYQFERYSDAANTYFLHRSKVISIIVAMIVAFTLNIDSFRLFSGFLQNRELASSFAVMGQSLQEGSEQNADFSDEYNRVLVERLASAQLSGLAIGPTQYPYCQTLYDIGGVATLAKVEKDVLKLGLDPRCQDDSHFGVARTGLVAPIFSRGRTDIIGRFIGDRDKRMGPPPALPTAEETTEPVVVIPEPAVAVPGSEEGVTDTPGSEPVAAIEADAVDAPPPATAAPEPENQANTNNRQETETPSVTTVAPAVSAHEQELIVMLIWLLSVFISGGLIGLGAPFWAKTYGQIAALVPAMKVIAPLVGDRSTKTGAQVDRGGALPVYRDRSRERANRDGDEFLRMRDSVRQAFDYSLPPDRQDIAPPRGIRVGDSSARATSAQGMAGDTDPTEPSGDGSRPRRRLPVK